jgi:hypothetical protein
VPIGEHRLLVLVGRVHAYHWHDLRHVVHPVRAACAAGHTSSSDGAVTASRRPVRGPDRRLRTPAAAARPTRTDEVLRRYVITEISGQKVCKFFVCMTTMLSISR